MIHPSHSFHVQPSISSPQIAAAAVIIACLGGEQPYIHIKRKHKMRIGTAKSSTVLLALFSAVLVVSGFTPQIEKILRKTAGFENPNKDGKVLKGPPVVGDDLTGTVATTDNPMLTTSKLPEKLYKGNKDKEAPKVLGGVKIGLRKLVVVTGASSGLGLAAARTLAQDGDFFVIMAVRDVEKGKRGKYSHAIHSLL